MELFFPAANFVADPSIASDIHDFENRAKAITDTYYLTVYGTDHFLLQPVCSLDELRFVAGLLASLHIGRVSRELVDKELPNYNSAYGTSKALRPYVKGEKSMLQLVSEGESPLLHLSGIAAFLEHLPYHPKVRGSAPQAEALKRLAQVGERIYHANIVALKDADHRLWVGCFEAGLEALAREGLSLGARETAVVRRVFKGLASTPAILVFDRVNMKA